jgi:hypothetical protein
MNDDPSAWRAMLVARDSAGQPFCRSAIVRTTHQSTVAASREYRATRTGAEETPSIYA